jgi:hypothetical protein
MKNRADAFFEGLINRRLVETGANH